MYRNTRFCELLKGLPRRVINNAVKAHKADRYCKGFRAWNHLVAMIYGQVSGSKSLRELEEGFNSQPLHHYHLGCGEIKRSTLADANTRRSSEIFRVVCEVLIAQAHKRLKREAKGLLYLLDSSPISLKGLGYDQWTLDNTNYRTQGLKIHMAIASKEATPAFLELSAPNVNDVTIGRHLVLEKGATYVFDKGYNDYNWWFSIEKAKARFVTRFKINAGIETQSERHIPESERDTILEDCVVSFKNSRPGGHRVNEYFETNLRKISVHRPDHKGPMIIATNDMKSSAKTIADLYKKRWEVELFFKWIKQNLKIKRFLGCSENAVKIQIYTALIAYLLGQIYRRRSGYAGSLKMFFVILQACLFQRPEIDEEMRRRYNQKEEDDSFMQPELAL